MNDATNLAIMDHYHWMQWYLERKYADIERAHRYIRVTGHALGEFPVAAVAGQISNWELRDLVQSTLEKLPTTFFEVPE